MTCLPRFVSDEDAAAILLKGLTGEMLVRRVFPLKAGQRALVHAAAGGVGQLLTQWAKALGARVIATAGSPDKLRIARENGCRPSDQLRRRRLGSSQVRTLTDGEGVEVVYDGVGKEHLRRLVEQPGQARPSGPLRRLLRPSRRPWTPLALMRGGSLYLTHGRPCSTMPATTAELDEAAKAMFDLMRDGKLKVSVGQRFALRGGRRQTPTPGAGGQADHRLDSC